VICPTCGKDDSRKSGYSIFKDSKEQRYQCKACGRIWKTIGENPKLLYFDIETAPLVAYTWGAYQRFINPEDIVEDWFILGWAAKWVCSSSMYSYVVNTREVKKCDDSRIIKPLWEMFNEADVVIGHNSDKFDIKRMNWRWAIHNYKPPRPYRTVDTLKEARKTFNATSNKLDYLTKSFGLNGKKEHRKGLFKECKEGKADALRELREYNEVDVLEGESLYLKIRPWMKNHPNMGLYYETDTERCKNCGSTDLDVDELQPVYTSANAYECWTCVNCGAHGRTPVAVIDKDKRKSLMR
jgi:RNase_H superfamily